MKEKTDLIEEKDQDRATSWSRRHFLGAAAVAGAVLSACQEPGELEPEEEGQVRGTRIELGPERAPEGPVLKAGLIGCGGRGTGAALNFLEAGPNLEITALADVFEDRLDDCRQKIEAQAGVQVPEEGRFIGFDAYQRLIDSGVDIVLMAPPPHFRPQHFEAAVAARKHVFMEKPLAVDPPGALAIMNTAEKADAFGLNVVTGTQRRHQRSYIETYNRILDGAIGDIVAARYWNQGQLWYKEKQPGWSDMEHMIRDWVNWQWLSGDHIVEQHIHNIDVINWFTGSRPVKAVGMGGRMRRVTGDQYDFFDIDFELENGVHVHSMCRQIDGCANSVSEFVVGTKGASNCKDTIFSPDGSVAWSFEEELKTASQVDAEEPTSPYVQEHIDFVTAIRTGNRINEAVATAESTLSAIMGRMSAYTGRETSWDEIKQSDLQLGPQEYAMGPVAIEAVVPVPGSSGTEQT